MKKIIVITGTPASGKTALSERLAKSIRGSELIKSNDLVKEKHLFSGHSEDGEMVADMKGLKSEIEKRVVKSKSDTVIIEGHLLCDMRIRGAVAIVIREHLRTLLSRMEKRGYRRQKIEENIVSEAIDYCGVNAARNYGRVYEILGSDSTVKDALGIISGKAAKVEEIDLLGELNGMAQYLGKSVL